MAAFTINSETNDTVSTLESLYGFLEDFKNFKSILPEDRVEDFTFAQNECSFNIRGITPMKVQLVEKKPYEFLLFNSDGLGKFNFSLKVFFTGNAAEPGKCKVELTGDLNPFIIAMAEKPLTQLVNTMSLRLSELVVTNSDVENRNK